MGPTNVSSPRLPRVRGSPSLGPHGGARLCDAVGSLEASCHRVLSLKWHLDSSLEPQAGGAESRVAPTEHCGRRPVQAEGSWSAGW